jgi:hypothetical protein
MDSLSPFRQKKHYALIIEEAVSSARKLGCIVQFWSHPGLRRKATLNRIDKFVIGQICGFTNPVCRKYSFSPPFSFFFLGCLTRSVHLRRSLTELVNS